MLEQTTSFADIGFASLIVLGAGFYLYRKLFKQKGACGGGCTSCASSKKIKPNK